MMLHSSFARIKFRLSSSAYRKAPRVADHSPARGQGLTTRPTSIIRQSSPQSQAHRRPRCRADGAFGLGVARATVGPRESCRSVGKLAWPWSAASSACRTLGDRARYSRPTPSPASHTAASSDAPPARAARSCALLPTADDNRRCTLLLCQSVSTTDVAWLISRSGAAGAGLIGTLVVWLADHCPSHAG